jgi:hypothetical protein
VGLQGRWSQLAKTQPPKPRVEVADTQEMRKLIAQVSDPILREQIEKAVKEITWPKT